MDKDLMDRINNLMSELQDIKKKVNTTTNTNTKDKKEGHKDEKTKRIEMAMELIKKYLD